MCIYYVKRANLSYNSKEHIFPASLGGKSTLPIGIVSDQFNNDISKLEQDFIRNSYISFMKHAVGPGKRGSNSPQKAAKSKILIIELDREKKYSLGYSQFQQSYEIPHLYYDSALNKTYLALGTSNLQDADDAVDSFLSKCKVPNDLKIRTILDDRLPKSIHMFGIKIDIEENYNSFFAKHPDNTFELTLNYLRGIGTIKTDNRKYDNPEKIRLTATQNFKVEDSYMRIFGKIAFNFLAFSKGNKFVDQSPFDAFRNWVAYGEGNANYFSKWRSDKENLFISNKTPLPTHAHFIIITTHNNSIYGIVSLYGLTIELLISKNCPDSILYDGMICDWKHSKEYSIQEFLSR